MIDSRNISVWGEDGQKKLNDLHVMVIGSGNTAQYTAGGLCGLGVGKITIMDNSNFNNKIPELFIPSSNKKKEKVYGITDILKRLNPTIDILPIYSKFIGAISDMLRPDIIIDATNDNKSKKTCLSYALDHDLPFISSSCSESCSAVKSLPALKNPFRISQKNSSLDKLLMMEFEGLDEGTFTSGISAGNALEELRKIILPYDEEDILSKDIISYDLFSESRKNLENIRKPLPIFQKKKKVLVAGAGAIGNFIVSNLILHGISEMHILDFDTVEEHNYNRQIMLYDSDDLFKTDVLCNRVKERNRYIKAISIKGKVGSPDLFPSTDYILNLYEKEHQKWNNKNPETDFLSYEAFIGKYYSLSSAEKEMNISLITPNDLAKENYDIIFGAIDNKFGRIWMNEYAVQSRTPYIEGGASFDMGQFYTYIPEKTPCIDCQANLINYPAPQDIVSCAHRMEGSIIMSNMIIGSAMVGEGIKILQDLEDQINSGFRYRATLEERMYLGKIKSSKGHKC